MLYKKDFKDLTASEVKAIEKKLKLNKPTLQSLEIEYNKNLKEGEHAENLLCD